MLHRLLAGLALAALLPITAVTAAEEAKPADPTAQLSQILTVMLKGNTPDSVSETPVPGLYQVAYGPSVFYMTADGRYLFEGELMDLATRQNLTENTRSGARLAALAEVPESDMIVFAPKDPKHTITVFTDVDCGYCRKLHGEIEQLNARGIAVRYMAFPRAPQGTPTFAKSESVWCAADRRQAITDAKANKPVEQRSCDNPVAEQKAIGSAIGVTGTPAIVLEDGQLIPGYRPANELADALDAIAAQQAAAR